MRQILFEIPIPFTSQHLPIFGFGTMLFFAFLAANWVGTRVARRDGLNPEPLVDMGLWIFIWGIVGARVLFMFRNPDQFDGPLAFFKIWQGGIVFYGGVIAGVLVFLYYTKRFKLPPLRVLDVFAPAVAAGIAVGRIGCLLNGCCWGKRAESPWGIRFPAGSIPWGHQLEHGLIDETARTSLPVHPTQIYLALAGAALVALALVYFPRRKRPGEVMALMMLGYAVTRFGIEFLRDDEPYWADGLTISQNISVLVSVGGLVFWGYLLSRPPVQPNADARPTRDRAAGVRPSADDAAALTSTRKPEPSASPT